VRALSIPNQTGNDAIAIDAHIFRRMLSEGETEKALEFSELLLDRTRGPEERNHEMEAWLRMERALLGAVEGDKIGMELRWCVDRLSFVSGGSPLHGLSLLNLATWHRNEGEQMMALVTLSDISSSNGHPNDVIGLSRLESGRILRGMGDHEPAMRHLWVAMKRLSQSEMTSESLVCGMEWLDIAMDDVEISAPTMSQRIEEARPRDEPGNSRVPSNPEDIREVVERIFPTISEDLSGEARDDLGMVIDAGELIGEPRWAQIIRARIGEIQDSRVIEALQS
jgi:hypothetical protein